MKKELVDKANKVMSSNDKEQVENFVRSGEFQQLKDEMMKTWNEVKRAVRLYIEELKPVFRHLVKAKKESDHYIRYSSYTKKKSQRKNWKKWRKKS